MRRTLQIRKADEKIYSKLTMFNYSKFISEMMQEHGPDWIKKEVKRLYKIQQELSED